MLPHGAHVPLPSQTPLPDPAEQAVPAALGVWLGTPAVQMSFVHALPSTGRSVLSVIVVVPPEPSHTVARQSPGVCVAGVPEGAFVAPQALGTVAPHVRVLQTVSVPAQSAGTTHCVHAPAPLHTVPPP